MPESLFRLRAMRAEMATVGATPGERVMVAEFIPFRMEIMHRS